MKTEDVRNNLIKELNMQFSKTGMSFDTQKGPDDPITTFPSPTFEKPKMFEPKNLTGFDIGSSSTEIPAVRGIGFKNNNLDTKTSDAQEIYNMKELINSNPDNMRTLSYDTKTVKAQYALIKRKEWQDILFEDVDLFKPIDLYSGFKKFFHIRNLKIFYS